MESMKRNDTQMTRVLKKLNSMDDTERTMLIDKYSRITRDVYHKFSAQDYIDFSIDIFLIRTSKDELVDSYVNGNPVIDQPGCRLNDFLDKEIIN